MRSLRLPPKVVRARGGRSGTEGKSAQKAEGCPIGTDGPGCTAAFEVLGARGAARVAAGRLEGAIDSPPHRPQPILTSAELGQGGSGCRAVIAVLLLGLPSTMAAVKQLNQRAEVLGRGAALAMAVGAGGPPLLLCSLRCRHDRPGRGLLAWLPCPLIAGHMRGHQLSPSPSRAASPAHPPRPPLPVDCPAPPPLAV